MMSEGARAPLLSLYGNPMLSRMIEKILMRSVTAIVVSLVAPLMLPPGAFARDQDMSVIAHASSGSLACEIRKVSSGDSVQLIGVVSSSAAVTGNASFVLTKSGASGTSNIKQGNAFDLAADAEAHVSRVTINLGHQDHAVVEFIATSSEGIVCHATVNLEP
jgi:hypothetical protein